MTAQEQPRDEEQDPSFSGDADEDTAQRPVKDELDQHEEHSKKPYRSMLIEQIEEELGELRRPGLGLLLSSFSAGIEIGFSIFLMGVVLTLVNGQLPSPITALLLAGAYSSGYVFVIIGRSELFTEHTTQAIFPVLTGKASLRSLARLWVIVYIANLVGGALSALMTAYLGPALKVINPAALEELAQSMVGYPPLVVVGSGALAGWLMGQLAWLASASKDTITQLVLIMLVTSAIGLGHLHHAITSTIEVLAGMLVGAPIGAAALAQMLLWTTIGNAIGGGLFVAIIKYSHVIRRSQEIRLNVAAEAEQGEEL